MRGGACGSSLGLVVAAWVLFVVPVASGVFLGSWKELLTWELRGPPNSCGLLCSDL